MKVTLQNIGKKYEGREEFTLRNIDLEIEDKDFCVILGPSGCGKTTLLRMIAGLNSITEGDLLFNDKRMNKVPSKDRDIAMVFQSYALYPHMTVYDNMAFSLTMRKERKSVIDKAVREAAELLQITNYLHSKPSDISGGQRQRVALGRAMVRRPKVFLMDEPLSNLDAKLRVQMRLEIQKLHRRLKTTSLYVTHDQIEAMTLAERMIVMNQGMPEQIGTPAEVFEKPASVFVATFIGSPPMNLLPVQVDEQGQIKQDNGQPVQFGPEMVPAAVRGRKVFLGIRPEHIKLHVPGVTTQVEMVEILGSEQLLHLGCGDYRIIVRCPIEQTREYPIQIGEAIQIGYMPPYPLHWFDRDTGLRIEA